MLPLDLHAHILNSVSSSDLVALNSCVVAVTRSLEEFEQTIKRNDSNVVWGVGCHPGLPEAQSTFDIDRFRKLLKLSPVVGEVGLDGNSSVPMDLQINTFESIIIAIQSEPRLISIHSARATNSVLTILKKHRPIGAVLHWWRGTEAETKVAVELGCYFSFNAASLAKSNNANLIPRDRILTETDHPYGDRLEGKLQRPGNVGSVESKLGHLWGISSDDARANMWSNLWDIAVATNSIDLYSHQFKVEMLSGNSLLER